MADNFKFSGFPENESFEVPDPSSKSSKNRGFQGPSFADAKKEFENMSDKEMQDIINHLPPEVQKFMSAAGIDPTKMFQQVGGMLSNMTEDEYNAMCEAIEGMEDDSSQAHCGNCNKHSDDNSVNNIFPTGNIDFLFPDEFGSIECESSENLYEEFVARYGSDSTQYLDDNIGLRDFILNDITGTLDFDEIKNMRFIMSNENFILFYMEPKESDEYGYYAAVIKKGNNNFAVYIPTFSNTFGWDDEEEVAYHYNLEDDNFMFTGNPSNISSFKFLAANVIEFAVSFALAPKKKSLISPKDFGTIKTIRPSITGNSKFLPIGKIVSNGSTQATLLLKDAELPLDKDSYNLFMKFPEVINDHSLRFISSILFQVDYNECLLLDNVELKYTSDGKLYFDVEHLKNF